MVAVVAVLIAVVAVALVITMVVSMCFELSRAIFIGRLLDEPPRLLPPEPATGRAPGRSSMTVSISKA